MKKISTWINKNKLEFALLIILILITLGLRLYRINEYMTFLGDEGRDAIVVKNLLVNYDPPLLGPPTSVGNMYLGPLYYYMMAISMAIVWLNPVAAAIMVALIGTMSVGLIYYLAREWFGKIGAFSAAILYSLSPLNIIYSRSSWNPNPAPFFSLLIILSLYKAHQSKNYKWLILTGIAFAFVVQMHYLALIMLPVITVLWLLEWVLNRKKLPKSFWKYSIIGIVCFLILMSPLFIFDIRYNFMNYRALSSFFGNRETTVNLNVFNTLGRVLPIYVNNLISRYLTFGNTSGIFSFIPWIILLPLVYFIYLYGKTKKLNWPLFALAIWLGIGVLGLALYKQTIYDHYIGFLNPVPYLLFAGLLTINFKNKFFNKIILILGLALVFLISFSNLANSPLKQQPNNQLKRTQNIAKFIIKETQNKPFNFALIAERNYDPAYQYYLDLYGYKPAKVPFKITDQLFVVCEDKVCQPIGNPKQEISHFGWAKIEYEKELEGVRIFKLIHNNPVVTNPQKK